MYLLTFCAFGLILSNLLNSPAAYRFKLKNINNLQAVVRNSMNSFMPLFNKYSAMCIRFRNEDIENEFIEVYKKDSGFLLLIVEEFDKHIIEMCNGTVVFEASSSVNCGEIFDFLGTTRTLFYLMNDTKTAVLQSLEGSLSVTKSQEVIVLSLSDGSLFQLSPVFPQPRHFVRTYVSEVLHKPTNLKFENATLTVAIMYYIPFMIFEDENSTELELDDIDGIEASLLKELVRRLNVRVRLLVCNGWGAKLTNGSWRGGIAQAMQDGAADLAFANLWQVSSAYEICDLSPSLIKIKMAFLVRRPEKIDFRWQSFLTIFKAQVWFAVLVSFVVIVTAYWAGVQLDNYSWKPSWSSCLLTIYGYFIASYSHADEREGNTRFTLTSWSMFSLLFTTTLSSGIIIRLTIPLYEARVDTLQQLVEGRYYWTVQYYRDYNNDSDLIESMFDLKNKWARLFEKTYRYMDAAEISMKIETNKNITFPVQRYGNDFIVIDNFGLNGNKALYNFRLSTEEITSTHVAFGVQKNSPLLEQLSVTTLNILEGGLMMHWKDAVLRRWPQYDTRHFLIEQDIPTFGEPRALQLIKLKPVFYLLLFGAICALCVFVVEINL